jgi:hypothetical protein
VFQAKYPGKRIIVRQIVESTLRLAETLDVPANLEKVADAAVARARAGFPLLRIGSDPRWWQNDSAAERVVACDHAIPSGAMPATCKGCSVRRFELRGRITAKCRQLVQMDRQLFQMKQLSPPPTSRRHRQGCPHISAGCNTY